MKWVWFIAFLVSLAACAEETSTIELTPDDFTSRVRQGLWLILYYVPWCGHCKAFRPEFDLVAEEAIDGLEVSFGAFNVEKSHAIVIEEKITEFPTVFLYFDGMRVQDLSMYRSAAELQHVLGRFSLYVQFMQSSPPASVFQPAVFLKNDPALDDANPLQVGLVTLNAPETMLAEARSKFLPVAYSLEDKVFCVILTDASLSAPELRFYHYPAKLVGTLSWPFMNIVEFIESHRWPPVIGIDPRRFINVQDSVLLSRRNLLTYFLNTKNKTALNEKVARLEEWQKTSKFADSYLFTWAEANKFRPLLTQLHVNIRDALMVFNLTGNSRAWHDPLLLNLTDLDAGLELIATNRLQTIRQNESSSRKIKAGIQGLVMHIMDIMFQHPKILAMMFGVLLLVTGVLGHLIATKLFWSKFNVLPKEEDKVSPPASTPPTTDKASADAPQESKKTR